MEETIGFVIRLKDMASGQAKKVVKWLKDIEWSVKGIWKEAKKADAVVTGWLRRTEKSSKKTAAAFSSVSLALHDASHQLARITAMTAGVLLDLSVAGIKAAAEVEASNARLDFSLVKIGKNAEETRKRIDAVSLATTLTRREVTDMVTSLALQKIDAFHSDLDNLFVTMQDGSKKAASAAEILNDAVAFSGKNSQRIIRGVREAVSERKIRTGRWLSEDLEIGGKELAKWNTALKRAKGPQEAFNTLIGLMGERVGGVTASVENTLSFVLKQVDDWADKLADELFRDALPVITGFLKEVGQEFIQMVKDDHFASIRDTIKLTMEGVMIFARGLWIATKAVVGFVRAFPAIIPILVAVTALLAALAGVAIVIAAIVGPLLAFGGLIALLPTILLGLKAAAIAFAVIAGAVIAIGAPLLFILTTMTLLAAAFVKARSIGDFFDRWRLLISAVAEGFRNLEGSTTRLSEKTTLALEKKGLIGQFMTLMRWVVKAKNAVLAFKDEMIKLWPAMVEAMRPFLRQMFILGEQLGVVFDKKQKDDDLKSWNGFAKGLAGMISGITVVLTKMFSIAMQLLMAMAQKAFSMGIISTEEYARALGVPKDFWKLDEEQQGQILRGERVRVGKEAFGFLNMREASLDELPQDIRRSGDPNAQALVAVASWDKKRRESMDAMIDQFAGLGSGPAPEVVDAQTQFSQLGKMQQAKVADALRDAKISPEEFKMLSDMISKSFAEQLRANPLVLKVDKEALADAAGEGANASFDDGGS